MKSFAKYFLTAGLLFFSLSRTNAALIQTDPSIVTAVVLQTEALKKAYENRNNTQNKIAAAQATVASAMTVVHGIEKQILGYMQNASGAVQNLHQLKRIAELVSVTIPKNIQTLSSTIPDNMKQSAMVAALPSTYTDIATEVASLSTMVNTLVSGTHYTLGEKEKSAGDEKMQINLLSAAERYYIASEVVNRLENIAYNLWILNFKIKTMSWSRLFYKIDHEGWCSYFYGKSIAEGLINDWHRLASR